MMKKIAILCLTLFIAGCKPEKITLDNTLTGLSITPRRVLADGTSVIYISATLNSKTDADKLGVVFHTSAGQFVKVNDTLITQQAVFNAGVLQASVQLKAPNTAGTIYISATPAVSTQSGDYIRRDTANAAESVPAMLKLTPSVSFLKQNSGSEILLTATLSNTGGNAVSKGQRVIFEDVTLTGTPVRGVFRAQRLSTDATSTAVASYTQSFVPSTGSFYIRCTYLNASGQRTAIRDSCLINVTN